MKYTKIFHLADIHIRRGNKEESRYDEYLEVFRRTVKDIKELSEGYESLCVICGDIFHHKLQISPHGISLFYYLINNLSSLMPVIIIQGNHDFLQHTIDTDKIDLIEALCVEKRLNNVHYLKETGSYEFGNVNFGVVSIIDILKKGAGSGYSDVLPHFPEIKPNKFNIALSHVSIQNSKQITAQSISIDWFKGYKLACLGDIHIQTAKYNKQNDIYYGYPGSLVQQDFGESIYNHGYLVWNIENDTISVDKYHVYNSFARANVKIIKDELMINATDYISLTSFLKYTELPKKMTIRLYCKTDIHKNLNNISNIFNNNNIECEVKLNQYNIDNDVIVNSTFNSMKQINSKETMVEYIRSKLDTKVNNWEEYINVPERLKLREDNSTPKQVKHIIEKKNENIGKFNEKSCIAAYVQKTFKIEKVDFDWILPFGEKNSFVFHENQTTLINAPNGYGKSAFFECIVLGIFGESIPSRYDKSTSISIISTKRPKHVDRSEIKIYFYVSNVRYSIHRVFIEQKNNEKNILRSKARQVILYKYEDQKEIAIHTGARPVNEWIKTNICTLDTFLLSTMITQQNDSDFFSLSPNDQIHLLDSALHIDNVNKCEDMFKFCKKEYKDTLNHIKTIHIASLPSLNYENYDLLGCRKKHQDIKNSLNEKKNDAQIYEILQLIDNVKIDNKHYLKHSVDLPIEESVHKYIEYVNRINEYKKSIEYSDETYSFTVVDEEYINAEKEKWKMNVEIEKVDESIIDLTHKCKTLRDKFNVIDREYEKINNNQVIKSTETIENYNNYIKEKSILSNFLLKNQIKDYKKPSSSLNDIQKHKNDILTIVSKEELELTKDQVDEEKDKLSIITTSYTNKLIEYDDFIEEIEEVSKPCYSEAQCDAYIDNYNKNSKRINKLNSKLSEYIRGENIREWYECLKFDEECNCCISNKDKMNKKITKTSKIRLITKLQKEKDDMNLNDELYGMYSKTKSEWSKYGIFMERTKKMNIIKIERDQIKNNIEELNIKKSRYDSIIKYKVQYEMINGYLEEWKLYDLSEKNRISIEKLNILEQKTYYWETELRNIKQYNKWLEEYERVEMERKNAKGIYMFELGKLIALYMYQKMNNDLNRLYNNALNLRDHMDKQLLVRDQLKNEITTLIEKERELFLEISKIEDERYRIEQYDILKMGLNVYEEYIEEHILLFDDICNILKSFKSYMYNECVLPNIVNCTNDIVNNIFHERQLRLNYVFNENIIIWSVSDEDNHIYLKKLSGAQYFAISLGFRLALSYIGVTPFNCNQIFIDEGFVNFDNKNLQKVPNLIQNLRSIKNEIYLVSHLDEIKNCTENVINIQRVEGISKLSMGVD